MSESFRKKRRIKKWVIILLVVLIISAGAATVYVIVDKNKVTNSIADSVPIGSEIDSYKGVAVYNNGAKYQDSYGKNISNDGYSFGYKWQCVEYIKRFYYQVKGHKMPDIYGNAKDYFDYNVKQGELNEGRGLVQYYNDKNVAPKPDDLIVFTGSKYGHVAIVTEVGADYIEVIQQNVYGKTREKFSLSQKDGNYFVGDGKKPAGWLRKE